MREHSEKERRSNKMFRKNVRRVLSILMVMGLLISSGITAMTADSYPEGDNPYTDGSLEEFSIEEADIELEFLGNGGTPESQIIQIALGASFGESFEMITIPTRAYEYEWQGEIFMEVYEFIGWFTTPAGDGVQIHATDYITEESPRILFARWRGQNLPLPVLMFFGNGGTPEVQYVSYHLVSGATFAEAFALIEEPTKPGYTFRGWYAGGMSDIEGNYITFPIYAHQAVFDGNFYAQWERDALSGLYIEWFYAFNFVVHVDDLEEMDVIASSDPFVTLMPSEDGTSGPSISGTPIVLEMIELPTENLLGKHGPIVIGIEEDVVDPITREIYFFVVDDYTIVSGDYVIYKNHIEKDFADRGLITPELIVELSNMEAYAVWPFGGENVTDLVQFNAADIAAVVNATGAGEFAVNFQISRMESLIAPLLSFRPPEAGEGIVIITLTDKNGGEPQPGGGGAASPSTGDDIVGIIVMGVVLLLSVVAGCVAIYLKKRQREKAE